MSKINIGTTPATETPKNHQTPEVTEKATDKSHKQDEEESVDSYNDEDFEIDSAHGDDSYEKIY